MRNTFVRVALCLICVLAASHCGDDDVAVDAAGSGGGSGHSGSGSTATGGAGAGTGTGGTSPRAGGGAEGGSSGDVGGRSAGNAGRGGSSMGAAGMGDELDAGADDAGPVAGAAASGSGGSGGSSTGGEDPAVTQCLNDAMAAGQTIDDCERCLCQTGVCQTETNAIKDDVNANALVKCSQQNMCSGQCCLCGETCGLDSYGDGPCADEAKTAAGVAPSSGLEAALTVMQQCAESGPEDSACARSARLSACALAKCAAMCPNLPACQ